MAGFQERAEQAERERDRLEDQLRAIFATAVGQLRAGIGRDTVLGEVRGRWVSLIDSQVMAQVAELYGDQPGREDYLAGLREVLTTGTDFPSQVLAEQRRAEL